MPEATYYYCGKKASELWFDPIRNPAVCFRSIAIPAYHVPLSVTVLFIFWKAWGYVDHSRRSASRARLYARQLEKGVVLDEISSNASSVSRQGTPSSTQNETNASLLGFLKELLRIAMFLGPMAVSFLFVSFCFSCFGWRWVLFGRPAERPSYRGMGLVAGEFFLLLWCVLACVQRDSQRAYRNLRETLRFESKFCAGAVGLTVTIFTVAFGILKVWGELV